MSHAQIYKCHAPGCKRLCMGWLCTIHRKETGL